MRIKELTAGQHNLFHKQGYIIVPGFFSKAETDKLYNAALEDEVMRKHALDLNDQSGKKTKLSLWYTPGDDIYGDDPQPADGRCSRTTAGQQCSGMSLPHKANAKGTPGRWGLGMASGLWVLV